MRQIGHMFIYISTASTSKTHARPYTFQKKTACSSSLIKPIRFVLSQVRYPSLHFVSESNHCGKASAISRAHNPAFNCVTGPVFSCGQLPNALILSQKWYADSLMLKLIHSKHAYAATLDFSLFKALIAHSSMDGLLLPCTPTRTGTCPGGGKVDKTTSRKCLHVAMIKTQGY